MMVLGKLERVDLRDIWLTEAQDFTPWLAQPENLSILGDAIGIELELEGQEKNVGPFRADILCKDTGTDAWVLIENQLERTDHVHLGQLLTYAAGLQAVTIVWLAARFTEEHRAALDWLNDITDESFQFFGLEVELWKIGNSPAAPKFNIISKPNDWSRSIGQAARRIADSDLSETKEQQLRYWIALKEYMEQHGFAGFASRKPRPQHWFHISSGRTGFAIGAKVNSAKNRIGVELYMPSEDAKAFFHLLQEDKDSIEREIGAQLEWQELPEKQASRIVIFQGDSDPSDESDWKRQHEWMAGMLDNFKRTFGPRIKALDPTDWEHVEE